MKKLSQWLILVLAFWGYSQAHGYSTISEKLLNVYFSSPLDLVPSTVTGGSTINLLKWNDNLNDPPTPSENYSRRYHFGEWITLDSYQKDCVNVRNRVLMRDSQIPYQMRPNNRCKVGSGEWFDSYTDTTLLNSEEIQIDHMVPLKDSFINGAWKWNYQARCAYANFMGYRDHLIPISSAANMIKADRNPRDYMPPNPAYRCEYLKTWLSVKLIWKLGMQREEARSIKELIVKEGCDTSDFTFSMAELQQQRTLMQKMFLYCPQVSPFRPADSATVSKN